MTDRDRRLAILAIFVVILAGALVLAELVYVVVAALVH